MAGIVAVLLAAGSSSRMGQPKQLLVHKGQTLLEGSIEKLLAAGVDRVVVVLGAYADVLAPLCARENVEVVLNPDWALGMASSIRIGVEHAECLEAGHVLVALVDQPLLKAEDYGALAAKSQAFPGRIVAAAYAGRLGAPAIFPAAWLPELRNIQGDKGAAAILRQQTERIEIVPMPNAAFDWDSPPDIIH